MYLDPPYRTKEDRDYFKALAKRATAHYVSGIDYIVKMDGEEIGWLLRTEDSHMTSNCMGYASQVMWEVRDLDHEYVGSAHTKYEAKALLVQRDDRLSGAA